MSRHPRRRSVFTTALAGVAALALAAVASVAAAPSASAQPFTPGSYYQLIAVHSGKAIDIAGVSTEAGAMVQQWEPYSTGQNQHFRFESSGDGYYRVIARHSGMALDVYEWNPDNGAEIRQWDDVNGTNQQWSITDRGNNEISLINRFSGKALDVWEWSTEDGGRLSQYDSTGDANQRFRLVPVDGTQPPPQPPQPPPSGGGPVGWASTNGGTTGGQGGSTVTVSNFDQLASAIAQSGPLTIRVQGTINCSGMHRVSSDKSILGNGSNATIAGCGFTLRTVHNVIIRNLNFRDWDDDAINMEESTTNVWVDHNSFSNGYDGAVDIKRESDFITVSWNRIFNHDKSMLLGHSDNHTVDQGNLRVTYHHNWFDGSEGRHPRVRFGNPVHVFNNYYVNNEYGVASTMGAGVLVEGNYFENVDSPTHVGYASSGPGTLVFRNNTLVNSGTPETSGSVANIPYSYNLESSGNVRSSVMNGAGAGRINP